MKKLLWVVVLVVALAGSLAGARYWVGGRIEQDYRSALAAVPSNGVFRVKSESYSRGAFSSEARTGVELLGLPGGPISFSLVHRIVHGPLASARLSPFLAVVETTLEPAESSSAAVKSFFGTHPEFVALRDRTVVGFGGTGQSHLELPAFRRPFGEKQVMVDWQGLAVDTTIAADWSAYHGSSKLPGFVISAGEGELKAERVESTFAMRKGAHELFLGESGFTVGAVALTTAPASAPISLSGLRILSSSTEQDGLLAMDFSLGIDALHTVGIAFEKTGFDLRLSNFDAEFVALLKKQADALQVAGDTMNPETALAGLAGFVREHLPSFLSRGPVLEVPRLEIATREGRFSGTMQMTFDTARGMPADLPGLLGLLVVQAEAAVDEGLLRQIIAQSMTTNVQGQGGQTDPAQIRAAADMLLLAQLEPLVAQGYLRKENASYSASARYQGGQLTVNGIPLGGRGRTGKR